MYTNPMYNMPKPDPRRLISAFELFYEQSKYKILNLKRLTYKEFRRFISILAVINRKSHSPFALYSLLCMNLSSRRRLVSDISVR